MFQRLRYKGEIVTGTTSENCFMENRKRDYTGLLESVALDVDRREVCPCISQIIERETTREAHRSAVHVLQTHVADLRRTKVLETF